MSNNGTSLEIVTADSVCLLTVNPSASDAIPILQQHRNISGSSTPPQKPPRKLSCGDYGSTSGYKASQKRLLNSGSRANSNDDQSYHGSNSPPPVPQGIRRPSIIQDNHQSMMEPKRSNGDSSIISSSIIRSRSKGSDNVFSLSGETTYVQEEGAPVYVNTTSPNRHSYHYPQQQDERTNLDHSIRSSSTGNRSESAGKTKNVEGFYENVKTESTFL